MPNASSNAITNSTWSSESAPRSSTNDAVGVTSASSTPSCSTIICFTRSSTLAIHFLRDLLSLLLVSAKVSGPPGPNAAPHAHSPRKCNLPILFAPSSKVNFAPVAQPPLRHRMRFRQAMGSLLSSPRRTAGLAIDRASSQMHASVHVQDVTGDVAGLVAGQENYRAGHVARGTHATERDARLQFFFHLLR